MFHAKDMRIQHPNILMEAFSFQAQHHVVL